MKNMLDDPKDTPTGKKKKHFHRTKTLSQTKMHSHGHFYIQNDTVTYQRHSHRHFNMPNTFQQAKITPNTDHMHSHTHFNIPKTLTQAKYTPTDTPTCQIHPHMPKYYNTRDPLNPFTSFIIYV